MQAQMLRADSIGGHALIGARPTALKRGSSNRVPCGRKHGVCSLSLQKSILLGRPRWHAGLGSTARAARRPEDREHETLDATVWWPRRHEGTQPAQRRSCSAQRVQRAPPRADPMCTRWSKLEPHGSWNAGIDGQRTAKPLYACYICVFGTSHPGSGVVERERDSRNLRYKKGRRPMNGTAHGSACPSGSRGASLEPASPPARQSGLALGTRAS